MKEKVFSKRDVIIAVICVIVMLAIWPWLHSGTNFKHITRVGETAELDGAEITVEEIVRTENGVRFTVSVNNKGNAEFFRVNDILYLYNNEQATIVKDDEYSDYFIEYDNSPKEIPAGDSAEWTVQVTSEKKIRYVKMMVEKNSETEFLFVIDVPDKLEETV